MIISHKYKFIFIKTRKTAGTSLEVYLSSVCGEDDIITPIIPHVEPHRARNYEEKGFFTHIAGSEIKRRLNMDVWKSYFKFCIERNPWDKTLSHYHMTRARSNNRGSLDEYFKIRYFPVDREKYTDEAGGFIVDKIILYENLNSELSSVFSHLGVPFSGNLDIRAKSDYRTDRRHYKEVLTLEQSSVIKKVFSNEIEWFDYKY